MIYNLKNDFLSVAVSSLGAEIQSVNCCGKEYMWDGKEYFMEKHGFISDLNFKAVSVSDTELTLVAVENEKTLSAYPFKFEFTAKYTLNGKTLTSEYARKNTSDEVMPYMLGLHPAFALHGDSPKETFCLDFGETFTATQYRLAAPFINQTGFDRPIPDGKLYITDEIYNKGTIVLGKTKSSIDFVSPNGKVFNMKWSDNFANLCVWKWTDDKARFVCIEPWTNILSDGSKTYDLDEKKMQPLEAGKTDTYFYALAFC